MMHDTHLDGSARETALNTKVQTGFALSHKRHARMAFWCIWDKTGSHGRTAHKTLLGTFPSVGVGKDKGCIRFERLEKFFSTCVSLFNIFACAIMQISEEIRKHINSRLLGRKRWNIIRDMSPRTCLGPKVEFKPVISMVQPRPVES